MNPIFNLNELRGKKHSIQKRDWTAIVPMAGMGTRLNYSKPKALYPILGRSILDWLLTTLEDCCAKTVLVVSPNGLKEIESEVVRLKKQNFVDYVVQTYPRGMADAVLTAESKVHTPHSLVVWGDQVTIRSSTLIFCESLLEKHKAKLTLPSYLKKNPYICFDRDDAGKLIRVRQKREGEIHEEIGENDCGVFCFESEFLFNVLKTEKSLGKNTEEYNLLPLLPKFNDKMNQVLTLRLDSEEETLGVNTLEDAKQAERILSER